MAFKLPSYRHSAMLFVVTALLLLPGLDKIDVNIMEARNFVSAREMVQNNEFLLPTLNNEPRYQKPPLPTWLTAASGVLFGFDSIFGMRLPVVGVTFLLVFVFYAFSKRMGLGSSHSLNNGLILITSFYIFFAGRDNQWDMYAHGFMMVSLYFLWRLLHEEANGLQNSLLSGLFFGCSILSKGPVSLYALFLPFLISYGLVYRFPFRRRGLYLLVMLLSGLAIGLWWYVYVRISDPEPFKSMAARETSNWTSYELKPFYYYWSFFLQSGLWAIASLTSLAYPYFKGRVSNLKVYRFALLWTFVSLVLLSFIPEKKVRYLVSVLIPLAFTTGFYIEYLIRNFNDRMGKGEKAGVYFSFGVFALIGFVYPIGLVFLLKDRLQAHIFLIAVSSVLLYLCSFLIIKGLISKRFQYVFYSMIALFILVVNSLIPIHKEIIYNPYYSDTGRAQIISKEQNIQTYTLVSVAPEIVWDFGKPIPLIKQDEGGLDLPDEPQFGLMAGKQDSVLLKSLNECYQIQKIYRINLHYKNKEKDRLIKDFYLITKEMGRGE